MAGDAEKKLLIRNKRSMKFLRAFTVTCALTYCVFRYLVHNKTSRFTWNVHAFVALVAMVSSSRALIKHGRPRYAADGALIHAGEDLRQEGLTQYLWDAVYVLGFSFVVVGVSGRDYLWVCAYALPLYGGFVLYQKFMKVRNMIGGGNGSNGNEGEARESKAERRLRERREKRQRELGSKGQKRF
jgi:hypothetical protein